MNQCIKSLGSGKWMARTTVLVDGVPKRREKRFIAGNSAQNKQAAQDWVQQWERIRAGLPPSFPRVTTLGELVEFYLGRVKEDVKYVTWDGYNRNLSCLLSLFGPARPFLFSQWEINNYVRQRRHAGVGRGIIKELATLRYALHHIGIVPEWDIPAQLHRLPKKAQYVPSVVEYRTLVNACSPEASLALIMAVFAGLRDSEVFRVQWEHYSALEGVLSIPAEIRKTSFGNVVPVVSALGVKLDTLQSNAVPGAMIPFPSSTRKNIQKMSGGKWHGLQPARRLLVTVAEGLGYVPDQISLLTGHSRNTMVSRYSTGAEQLELKRRILEDVERRIIGSTGRRDQQCPRRGLKVVGGCDYGAA